VSTVDPIVAILRERREGLGWTCREVAHYVGAHEHTITKDELGEHSPSLDLLRRWADVLGYDVRLVSAVPQVVPRVMHSAVCAPTPTEAA
jgi:transcriptional regulator with XRE-family HTH domain